MIPRYGNPPEPGRAYAARPGVYAILPRDGAVLLTLQEAPDREYQLPGGGIDPGETPLRALHREVMEETGWRIDVRRRLGAFRRFVWMPDYERYAEKICHVYLARPVIAHGAPSEPGHAAVWMAPELAAGLLGSDGDAVFLDEARRRGLLR